MTKGRGMGYTVTRGSFGDSQRRGIPMIERIHVENYKCLRDVTVDLGDFTILIGPNDSGKSSFLEVIEGFGRVAQHGYAGLFGGHRSPANLVWRKDASRHIVLQV